MAKYASSILGVAASTNANSPNLLVVSAATGAGSALGLYEVSLSGEASSSGFVRLVLNRPSAVTIGGSPTTQAPQPLSPASVAAAYTVYTSTGSGPSITAGTVHQLVPAFNAFGGVYTWLAAPGGEIVIGTQGTSTAAQNLMLYSLSGTSNISGHVLIEEY